MIQGMTYAILTTADLPRAKRFYKEQLGLATEEEQGETFAQLATREGAGWAIMAQPPGTPPVGTMLYVQVADVDEAYRTWRERGVETVTEPEDRPFGRTFAFRDPDGRVLHAIGAA